MFMVSCVETFDSSALVSKEVSAGLHAKNIETAINENIKPMRRTIFELERKAVDAIGQIETD